MCHIRSTAKGGRASSSALLLSSLELSDTTIYEPSLRAFLGTAPLFCQVVVLNLSTPSARSSSFEIGMGDAHRQGVIEHRFDLLPRLLIIYCVNTYSVCMCSMQVWCVYISYLWCIYLTCVYKKKITVRSLSGPSTRHRASIQPPPTPPRIPALHVTEA